MKKKTNNNDEFYSNFTKLATDYCFATDNLFQAHKLISKYLPTDANVYQNDENANAGSNASQDTYSDFDYSDKNCVKPTFKNILSTKRKNEFIKELNNAFILNKRNITKKIVLNVLAGILFVLSIILFAFFKGFYLPILLLIVSILLLITSPKKIKVKLNYELPKDSDELIRYTELLNAVELLCSCEKLCEITATLNLNNYKYYAGANNLIRTTKNCTFLNSIYEIDSDVEYRVIEIERKKLIFFPDMILIYNGSRWSHINYNNLETIYQNVEFAVNETLPNDTKVLTSKWLYQNKNGEPDNRFSDNKIIPICAYGQIAIVVKPKLKLMLMGSNQNNMEKFYKTLADYVM